MPRPSKHVSPETLGGRLRAARQNLRLSLAEVAAGHYSTSLISQIERNRVDPSEESLHFLAERLELPLEELIVLAQHHREVGDEARQYKHYEELRQEALQLLTHKDPHGALELLKGYNLAQIPSSLRWRLAALRGQCYFSLRQFLAAQKDFLYAVIERPELVPPEHHLEAMTLHLHLAATHRELQQLEAAIEQFQAALSMMNHETQLGYVAESQWGLALVAFEQAHKVSKASDCTRARELQLQVALKHAENASFLYRSIGKTLQAALLTCLIALIEQGLGNRDSARKHLQELLDTWLPTLDETQENTPAVQGTLKERANVVSAAACALAGIELEAGNLEKAQANAELAQRAGEMSYILRRAEAQMMLGRILEASNRENPAAEQAFRGAIAELASTDRVAAQIRAHDFLGRHLLKKGETSPGEQELDEARQLSNLTSASGTTISAEDRP